MTRENLVEELEDGFDVRRCSKCNLIRLLGSRAAKKYPNAKYMYAGAMKKIQFECRSVLK